MNVEELISNIKKRPGMYVGCMELESFHSEEEEADGDSRLNADGSVPEAPYSYLYQQGFVSSNRVKVTIKWRADLSKSSQILILKNIYPVFKEVSVRILLEEARRNEEQWEFAEMWWGQAVDIMELAKEKGLDILIEEIEA